MADRPATKERPILYSAPMVNAILAGIKTQTRRVVKGDWIFDVNESGAGWEPFDCPYGQVGDRLWVRETFAIPGPGFMSRDHDGSPIYAADYPPDCPTGFGPWKPSIFMPRAASRITLEITEVRVQRAQEISDEDIIAEGIAHYIRSKGLDPARTNLRAAWIDLWDTINAKREGGRFAWDRNPWTWALTFKRVKEAEL